MKQDKIGYEYKQTDDTNTIVRLCTHKQENDYIECDYKAKSMALIMRLRRECKIVIRHTYIHTYMCRGVYKIFV